MEMRNNQVAIIKEEVLKTFDEIQAKLKYDVDVLLDVYDTVIKLAKKLDPTYEDLRKEFGDEHSLDKERIRKWAEKYEVLKDCNMMEHIIYKLNEIRNNISNAKDVKDIAYNLANFAADLACKLYSSKGGHIHFSGGEPVVACESLKFSPPDEKFKADGWRALRKFREMIDKIKILRENLTNDVESIANTVNELTNIIVKYEWEFRDTNELSEVEWLGLEELKSGLSKLSADEIAEIADTVRDALDNVIKASQAYEKELVKIENELKEEISGYSLCKINMYRECDNEVCHDILYDIIYELADVVGHVHCVAKGYPCGGLDLEMSAHIDCGCTEDDISPIGFCGHYPSLEKGIREKGKEEEEEKCRESL